MNRWRLLLLPVGAITELFVVLFIIIAPPTKAKAIYSWAVRTLPTWDWYTGEEP